MDIRKNLLDSFHLYIQNFVLLLGATLIVAILSGITLGILAGPLMGGLLVFGLKLARGEKGEFNEIFAHFDQFGQTLLVTVCIWIFMIANAIIGWVPVIGWIFGLAVGPLIWIFYFLAIGLVVIEKKTTKDALQKAVDYCADEPLLVWAFAFVSLILAGIGAMLFMVPVVLTMPFGVATMVVAYRQLTNKAVEPLNVDKKTLRIIVITLGVLLLAGIICRSCLVYGF